MKSKQYFSYEFIKVITYKESNYYQRDKYSRALYLNIKPSYGYYFLQGCLTFIF